MRLTLRTLLAYLDDRLSPANARELGQKIVQSPFATELADRIRNVVRRRRLATESGDHKSIDANLIAEYLDDQLTPELVALIEKEVLGSDHNLAEVAANHQILGLLSDPVELHETLRGRLHKLDPLAKVKDDTVLAADPTSTDWKPLAPQAATGRRSPMLLLLLMVVGWLALLFSDPHLFRSAGDSASTTNEAAGGPVEENVNAPPDVKVAVDALPKGTPVESTTNPQLASTIEPKVTPVTEPVPAVAEIAPAAVVAGTTPADTQMKPTVVATDVTAVTPEPPAIQPLAVKPAIANHVFTIRDGNRIHLLRDPETTVWEWASAPDGELIGDWGKRLTDSVSAIPDPFLAQLSSDSEGWTATIAGSSLFRSVANDVSGVELFEGRLVLQRHRAGEVAQVTLLANGRPITLALPGVNDRIGVSVIPLPTVPLLTVPPDNEVDTDADVFPFGAASIVTVFAADHPVELTAEGLEQPVTIGRGKAWQWNTAEMPSAETSATPQLIPEWVYQTTTPPAESTKVLIAEAATTLRSEAAVRDGAVALSRDRNPQLAVYGVRLSSLIRDVDQLTDYLLQPNDDGVRQEAIVGLRTMIRQSDAGRQRVQSVLAYRLSNTELENAMKMLEGTSKTAAEDRFVSNWLIEMLASNRSALRAMAIENLEAITNERNGFTVDGDAGRRSAAIKRWERFLERNEGRLMKPNE
jgi:hypothetical protein